MRERLIRCLKLPTILLPENKNVGIKKYRFLWSGILFSRSGCYAGIGMSLAVSSRIFFASLKFSKAMA